MIYLYNSNTLMTHNSLMFDKCMLTQSYTKLNTGQIKIVKVEMAQDVKSHRVVNTLYMDEFIIYGVTSWRKNEIGRGLLD